MSMYNHFANVVKNPPMEHQGNTRSQAELEIIADQAQMQTDAFQNQAPSAAEMNIIPFPFTKVA